MIKGSKAVVTVINGRTACFYLEDGKSVEIFFEKETGIKTGDIFVGRVSAVKKDLNAAFVDVSPGDTGFLPFEKGFSVPKEGDEIPVLVTAEAQKNKPFSLSRELSVHGLYTVAIPDKEEVRVSSKLGKEDKDRLRALALSADLSTGVIIRTAAVSAPEETVSAEMVRLSDKLHEILQTAGSRSVYSRLYEAKPAFYERIEECKAEEIVTDDPAILDKLKAYIDGAVDVSKPVHVVELRNKDVNPAKDPDTEGRTKVSLYRDESMPLSVLYGLNKKYSEATDKKVSIRTGGFLYIEPTEALTVIDVNSGKIDKTKDRDTLIRETNFEAAKEVFRQLRLRNLSGIIVVDFINFKSDTDRAELENLMKDLARRDPVKTSFVDFTTLGLAELTRQKKYAGI